MLKYPEIHTMSSHHHSPLFRVILGDGPVVYEPSHTVSLLDFWFRYLVLVWP